MAGNTSAYGHTQLLRMAIRNVWPYVVSAYGHTLNMAIRKSAYGHTLVCVWPYVFYVWTETAYGWKSPVVMICVLYLVCLSCLQSM